MNFDKIAEHVTTNLITIGIVTTIFCIARLEVSRELFMNGRTTTKYSIRLAI
jgi:hypothetical protein